MSLDDASLPKGTFGVAIVADDIRQEADGKITIVGAYGSEINVNADFPVRIPKVGFSVFLFIEPRHTAEILKVSVYLPGEETPIHKIEDDVPIGFSNEPDMEYWKRIGREPRVLSYQLNFIIPFVTIKEEGRIDIFAELGSERVRIPAALIKRAPSQDSTKT